MDPDLIALGMPDLREASFLYSSPSQCCLPDAIEYLIFGYEAPSAVHGYIALSGVWKEFTSAYILKDGAWKSVSLINVDKAASWKATV